MENEEASASVVVKMTDSFTEQADQVIPEKDPHVCKHCGRGTVEGEGRVVSTGDMFFLYLRKPFELIEGNLEKVKTKQKNAKKINYS